MHDENEFMRDAYVEIPPIDVEDRALVALSVAGAAIPVLSLFSAIINGIVATKQRHAIEEISRTLEDVKVEMNSRLGQENLEKVVIRTVTAVAGEADEEKINLFKNAFKNFSQEGASTETDDYLEAIEILRDLTLREFKVLMLLTSIQDDIGRTLGESGSYYYNQRKVKTAGDRFMDELGLNRERVDRVLARLPRTGLYDPNTINWDIGTLRGFDKFLGVLGIPPPEPVLIYLDN